MAHWWDANPYASHHACRGWTLRSREGRLVGYLGVIPSCYEDATGSLLPALLASSWAVDEEHRQAALPMGLQLNRQGGGAILIDTTPSPAVQKLLQRWGWEERRQIQRRFLLRFAIRGQQFQLPAHMRIISDPNEVRMLAATPQCTDIRRHVTPEYLRWYVGSRWREHHFLGMVDAEGALWAYVIVTPHTIRGVPAWSVVDWHSVRDDSIELGALVARLARRGVGTKGRWWPLVIVTNFPEDDPWQGLPHFHRRSGQACHFHSLPPTYKGQPKRSVLAEGDWGL